MEISCFGFPMQPRNDSIGWALFEGISAHEPCSIFCSFRAADRMSTAQANGRRPDPVDVEQLGLTEVMQRSAAAGHVIYGIHL